MHCVNPGCGAESLYFRSGSLHWLDRKPGSGEVSARHSTRLIWLCAACSRKLEVQTWRPAGQQLRCSRGEVIQIDRDRRRPEWKATPRDPISQSA